MRPMLRIKQETAVKMLAFTFSLALAEKGLRVQEFRKRSLYDCVYLGLAVRGLFKRKNHAAQKCNVFPTF